MYLFSFLIPKKKNLWIFGSWFSKKYTDNSKFLFEYVNKNHKEIEAVWITAEQCVMQELQSKNSKVVYRYSLKGLWYVLRAKSVIFVQGPNEDILNGINWYVTKNIQLWHGTPLKKINYDDNLCVKNRDFLKFKLFIKKIFFPVMYYKYDFFPACSNEDKKNFASAFLLNSEKVKITGYPRNDIFLNNKQLSKKMLFKIIYMPTFRGEKESTFDFFTQFAFNQKEIEKKLKEMSAELFLKLHPVNKPNSEILVEINNSENIFFYDENSDIYEELHEFGILITDFSSVYFDYLLTDKPIIFASFDLDEYLTNDRELYYDYDEVTPGPKCKDWNEVIEWIEKFKNNPDLFSDERGKIKNKFHKYHDGKSCERVYQEILKITGSKV